MDRSTWMSKLPDSSRLSDITIPGSHDSMSLHGGFAAQTQSLFLQDQLKVGIRAIDIRCRWYRDSFPIHHGIIFQKTYFDSVLQTVVSFLHSNPNETILLKIKQEYDSSQNTKSFWQIYQNYVAPVNQSVWIPTSANPNLSEIRGKIVILDDYSTSSTPQNFTSYGISYKSRELFDSQNFYQLKTPLEMTKKWKLVKNQALKANNSRGSSYFVNHLSGNGDATGVFPYFVASGRATSGPNSDQLFTGVTDPLGKKMFPPEFPRRHCLLGICMYYFEGMNTLMNDFIKNNDIKFVGIVYSDFPGDGLIDTLINLNFK
ncbi:1-phosphatidylinositol phosphodiesterase [Folsomia candida]|uniref:1-phosphatidylinositol phosphodiesterase n=1 Tax=Folsomia candida TaxID=158441 RepID=A0A226DNE3_FOLCA|nr:1-phosphatidylinositol phosphodiesterase [Folsomia candida]